MRPVARDLGQPGRARSAPLVPRVFVRARPDPFGWTLSDSSLAMHAVAPLRLPRAWECTAGTARAGKGSAGKRLSRGRDSRHCTGAGRARRLARQGGGGAVFYVVRLVVVPGALASV